MTPFGSSIWTLATGVPVIAPGRFSVCVPPEGRKKFHEAYDAAVSVTVTVTVECPISKPEASTATHVTE